MWTTILGEETTGRIAAARTTVRLYVNYLFRVRITAPIRSTLEDEPGSPNTVLVQQICGHSGGKMFGDRWDFSVTRATFDLNTKDTITSKLYDAEMPRFWTHRLSISKLGMLSELDAKKYADLDLQEHVFRRARASSRDLDGTIPVQQLVSTTHALARHQPRTTEH
jgi:hypothetical protein